jgi:hypothetical protein
MTALRLRASLAAVAVALTAFAAGPQRPAAAAAACPPAYSVPASHSLVVQVLTYVTNGAGTASGSGFVSQMLPGPIHVTHGGYLSRSSGWGSMDVDATGIESNVTCTISAHTTNADPAYSFNAPP